jgi:hypothetical protein
MPASKNLHISRRPAASSDHLVGAGEPTRREPKMRSARDGGGRFSVRRLSILEQQFRSGAVDITTSGQNHRDPELLSKNV